MTGTLVLTPSLDIEDPDGVTLVRAGSVAL
jgi:hypothetical protein